MATDTIELSIDGMTCASCANRIERKLNKIDGVTATVNFATEKARVEYGDGVTPPRHWWPRCTTRVTRPTCPSP